MTQSDLCPLCNNGEENLLHVFRDCTAAAQVWNLISESKFPNDFMIGDFPNWQYLNLSVMRLVLTWSGLLSLALQFIICGWKEMKRSFATLIQLEMLLLERYITLA